MIATALTVATPITGALAGLTYASVAPTPSFWGPVIAHGPSDTNQIALTFDDGPTPGSTERVLDILAREKVPATFFVIGQNAQSRPDLLRRMHDDGHLIGNHTWSHSHFTMMHRWPWWQQQIRETDKLVESITGTRPRLFRPPMGVRTWHTTIAVKNLDHRLITWSRRARDGLRTTPTRILDRFAAISAGDILLLHDGVEPHSPHGDRSATVEALAPLIDRIREKGLSPTRLDQLI